MGTECGLAWLLRETPTHGTLGPYVTAKNTGRIHVVGSNGVGMRCSSLVLFVCLVSKFYQILLCSALSLNS